MTLRSSDLQSDSDLDSIRNSCDVLFDSSLKHQMIAPLEEVRSYEAVKLDVIFDFMRKIINFAKNLNF